MFEIVREGQADVENTNPAPGAPGAAALQDPLDVEAARVAEMVEQAQSRFDGMLFTATPTQDLDAVTACQHLANQAFALMLRTLTALTNRAGSDERQWVPDEIALALNVSSGTGWSLQHLAVQACELPGLVEAVEANQLGDRVQTVQRAADATYLAVRAESRVIARADLYLRGGTAQVEEVLTDPGHRGRVTRAPWSATPCTWRSVMVLRSSFCSPRPTTGPSSSTGGWASPTPPAPASLRADPVPAEPAALPPCSRM